MDQKFYSSASWRRLRLEARERDNDRCTVGRLLGGACSGLLHGHHIDSDGDPLALDNVATVCASHHPRWEKLRRMINEERQPQWRRCRHRHRTAEGRRQCERRLNAGQIAA